MNCGFRSRRGLVIDDDEAIAWSWRKRQQRLGITQLHTFTSMEACEASGIAYAAIDLAFLDLHNPETTWPLQRTIQHLKARGIRRVFVATGAMDADASAACAQADGVATDKVPADLAPYLKLTR